MPRHSSGILMYRVRDGEVQVFLVHPGGPLWASRDAGAWSIPKGELEVGEDALEAAKREFAEETGSRASGDFTALRSMRQSGGKIVHAWALRGECDPASIESNVFSMEWPARSGQQREFPEIDRADWFSLKEARVKLLSGQVDLIDQLCHLLESEEGR